MKKLLLITAQLFITIVFFAQTQTFDWANLRGSSGSDYIYSIATDNEGNVYNVGIYSNASNDFDYSNNVVTLPFSSSNDYSVYIQKLDASGNFLWAKTLDSPSSTQQRVSKIVTATNGDLIISGSFKGGLDFDMGTGSANVVSNNSGANVDAFILRLTQDGDFVWVKTFGGNNSNSDEARFYDLDLDSQGNIFVAGYFSGSVDADPGAAYQMLYAGYDREALIIKLNSSGVFQWAHQVGAPSNISGNTNPQSRNILIDSDDNVWFTLDSKSGDLVYSGYPSSTNTIAPGGEGIGILKVSNATGVPLVNNDILVSQGCLGLDMAKDVNDNIYITGTFRNTIESIAHGNIYNGNGNVYETPFTISYDKNLNIRWALSMGAQPNCQDARFYSIAYQSTGLITMGGFVRGDNFTIASQTINNPFTSPTNARMAQVLTLDTLGTYVWGGAIASNATYDQLQTIHVDNNDNIYLGGYISSSTNNMDPLTGNPTDAATNGGVDPFLVKLSNATTRVNNFEGEKKLKLYPNPVVDNLYIEGVENVDEVQILTLTGKVVKNIQNKRKVNISDLTKGVYMVKVTANNKVFNNKIVKN